jgi:AmmeMemoRadiSam system protein B
MPDWYPQNKEELSKLLESFLSHKPNIKRKQISIAGIIVPHAGYAYSGEIAAEAYSLLKNQDNKNKIAIIISPSHYINIQGIATHNQQTWTTSLGTINIKNKLNLKKMNISQEHAIDNQIPFLQKLGFKEILPLLVGELTILDAENIAKKLSKFEDYIFIFSTDLSHFLPYEQAKLKDSQTIDAITKLNSDKLIKIENCACGIFPLLILIELCKLKNWQPKLINYKNSGDITGDKDSVVGYASMIF